MKVTKARVVTSVGFVMSSLLLILAANCSFDRALIDKSPGKPTEEAPIEQQAVAEQAEHEFFVANPFCAACHYGFDDEELAFKHELAGIGCERCHGESERHRSDEDNITPPEIMYPKARINPTCMICHPRGEINHVREHKPLLAGAKTIFDPEIDDTASGAHGHPRYCTDCHAKRHRINVRTIQWNKATGELLE
ncbi:MAG: multiheme c-type cytochrome [Planctomycetota bacterium]|jgi:hypothetical protein